LPLPCQSVTPASSKRHAVSELSLFLGICAQVWDSGSNDVDAKSNVIVARDGISVAESYDKDRCFFQPPYESTLFFDKSGHCNGNSRDQVGKTLRIWLENV
jgi:hypothetical protein